MTTEVLSDNSDQDFVYLSSFSTLSVQNVLATHEKHYFDIILTLFTSISMNYSKKEKVEINCRTYIHPMNLNNNKKMLDIHVKGA